jgi:hypothetical protein
MHAKRQRRRRAVVSSSQHFSYQRAGVILRGAPPHDHKEEHMERHTVEYTFEGEKLSSVAGEYADLTLYRTDEDGYFVYLDARKVGGNSVLETGENPRGFSGHDIRVMWPELLEAQRRQ